MPALRLTEYGKLSSWGLIRHYQQKQSWYIQQGKALVAGAKFGVSAAKTVSGSVYVFSQEGLTLGLFVMLFQDVVFG